MINHPTTKPMPNTTCGEAHAILNGRQAHGHGVMMGHAIAFHVLDVFHPFTEKVEPTQDACQHPQGTTVARKYPVS